MTGQKTNNQETLDNLIEFVNYWRLNIHRFCVEYLGLDLHDFQQFTIYTMDSPQTTDIHNFIFFASRGAGKSWLAMAYCIAKCILFPGIVIKVASITIPQANMFLEKVYEIQKNKPNIIDEIEVIRTTKDIGEIIFKNGSSIESVVCSKNARGARANILVFDESGFMDYDIIDSVLTPFLTKTHREQPWHTDSRYKKYALAEHSSKIFLTSIGGAEERSYKDFVSHLENAMKGMNNYFSMSLPYYFGIDAGVINRSLVESQMKAQGVDIRKMRQEYEVIPYSDNESSVFSYSQMAKARKLLTPLIPPTDYEYIECNGRIDRLKTYTPLIIGEQRVISIDVAVAAGRRNDNSIITVFRIFHNVNPDDGVPYYIKEVSYMEAMHGVNIDKQIVRLKQLFYDLECSYAVIDAGGPGGIMAANTCGNVTNDIVRNKRYPGWKTFNYVEKFDIRVTDQDAEPVLYCKIVSGASAQTDTMNMITKARVDFDRGRISLLQMDEKVIDDLNDRFGYLKLKTSNVSSDIEKSEMMITTAVNTTEFVNECINLLFKRLPSGKWITDEGKGRKDRFSSFIYGLSFIHLLENDLMEVKQRFDIGEYFNYSESFVGESQGGFFSGSFNGFGG